MSRATSVGAGLPPEFCARPATEVARDLLGRVLLSTIDGERVTGRIVETEAYVGPHDPASHAAERIGRTARNEPMFGPPGTAYVYRIYGVHWCLNVVTDRVDYPAAVLIRALEPLDGVDTMARRRGLDGANASGGAGGRWNGAFGRRLTGGPGRLAAALSVTGGLNGHELSRAPLRILAGDPVPPDAVSRGPRIGVTRAADWPLRFRLRDHPCVSAR